MIQALRTLARRKVVVIVKSTTYRWPNSSRNVATAPSDLDSDEQSIAQLFNIIGSQAERGGKDPRLMPSALVFMTQAVVAQFLAINNRIFSIWHLHRRIFQLGFTQLDTMLLVAG